MYEVVFELSVSSTGQSIQKAAFENHLASPGTGFGWDNLAIPSSDTRYVNDDSSSSTVNHSLALCDSIVPGYSV